MCKAYIIISDKSDKHDGGYVECQEKGEHIEHHASFEKMEYRWGE